ncbi:MAG TPA: CoA transferase [Candidatus Saccharimonadales bacterium]|nr:CoA transferase [Candidatus Saccharimonadales bacterium]
MNDVSWPTIALQSEPGQPAALAGLRVLDLSRALSGPFATLGLADLGADVVKIEAPEVGDETRHWGPPFQGDQAAYFLSVNRNKRSAALDLKDPDGIRVVRSLAAQADVFVENFRPGVAARLGLGYEELSRTNPGLVYASISGFGQTGPDSELPGYDAIAQARSGIMSVTGEPDGPPLRVGVPSADLAAGMWAMVGILAALVERQSSGRGQWVDIALLDAQASLLTYIASSYFATGVTPRRQGAAHSTIVPYQDFATKDSRIIVAVGNDRLFHAFARATGLDCLIGDPRFTSNADRVVNRDALVEILSDRMATKTSSEWVKLLAEHGIPAATISTIAEMADDPQIQARGMILETEHRTAGHIKMLACPLRLSRTPPSLRLPPPTLGEHTLEMLRQ